MLLSKTNLIVNFNILNMKYKIAINLIIFSIFSLLPVCAQESKAVSAGVYNVKDFGARGDGKNLDSPAISKAIDAAASAGGGTVFFPAGTYICGSVQLKSNISLYLDQGSIIEASSDTSVYNKPEHNPWDAYQDFGHSHWHNSLLWGEDIHDISILGPGLIYGKGLTRSLRRDSLPQALGNKSIALKNCHNVILRDFSILKGGHFGMLLTGVDNLTIDNLKIDTNRDGMDIDCCSNVRVSNCSVNSPWDDGICLKSCYALGYNKPTQNVTITNCYVTGGLELGSLLDGTFKRAVPPYQVNRTGRIKLGTESNGGFKNITISNCVFEDCQGLALETVDGGYLEDISVSNITMRDIVNAPIFLRLGSRMRAPQGTPQGVLRRVNISDVVVYNATPKTGSEICGIPGNCIEDVHLNNILIYHQGGGTADQAFVNPPEKADAYPEPGMFGTMPAYGFSIRHVKNIELNNVEVKCLKEDQRPAFWLNDVNGAGFQNIKVQKTGKSPVFKLKDVENFSTHQVKNIPDVIVEKTSSREL